MPPQTRQEFNGGQSRQQNMLQLALAKLRDQELTEEQVRRVAVERSGVMHIEIHEAGAQRFFAYQANELQELWPQKDSKIPLALKLADDKFAQEHTMISYRPGRRVVLGPAHGAQGHIIKGFRKNRAAHAAELYAIATSLCEQTGFDVPELLQYVKESDCIVMAMRPGSPPEIDEGAVEVWEKLGSCLRQFQHSSRAPELVAGLQNFGCQDELAVLDERARRFLLCLPNLPERWLSGRQQLAHVAIHLPLAVNGLAHRDLHDRQFIVSGNSISLLDFDLVCCADVALDAGNLLVHMKLRAIQGRQVVDSSGLTKCSKAFLSGLGRQHDPGFERRLLFYQASSYFRLALLYALRPRWMHLSEVLTHLGWQCIGAFNHAQDDL